MLNHSQKTTFLALILALSFVHCTDTKHVTDAEVTKDLGLTAPTPPPSNSPSGPGNDGNSGKGNGTSPSPKGSNKPTQPNGLPLRVQPFMVPSSTPTDPTNPVTNAPKDKAIIPTPASTTTTPASVTNLFPTIITPPSGTTYEPRSTISMEQLKGLQALTLPPQEKAMVDAYIQLINSSAGVTKPQSDAIAELIKKYNPAPVETPQSTKNDEINYFLHNPTLEKAFETFANSNSGKNNFNYAYFKGLLEKQELTTEEQLKIAEQYFAIMENTDSEILNAIPLVDRISGTLGLLSNTTLKANLISKYANAPQMKVTNLAPSQKTIIATLLYGFELNKKLNPQAVKDMKSEDQVIVYTAMGETESDKEPGKFVPQKYTFISVGRFDFSDPKKKNLTEHDLAFAKDIGAIWDGVAKSVIRNYVKAQIVGFANRTSSPESDIQGAEDLATSVSVQTKMDQVLNLDGTPTFKIVGYNIFALPNENPESIKNRRVELVIMKSKTVEKQ